MNAPAPFDELRQPDPDGWRGGKTAAPLWERSTNGGAVDARGFHALLRSAGLPRVEMLHMGISEDVLDRSGPEWIGLAEAAAAFGAIVWDHRHACRGDAVAEAGYGRAVLQAWWPHG